MAQAESTTLASSFKSMFDREKLTGSANFNDWYRQLRIVLRVAKRLNYLTTPCPPEPAADATAEARAAWQSEYDKYNEVACIMLGSMNSSLQKQFENYFPNLMLEELQKLF